MIVVPRNFVLLEELERTEKGQTDMNVSYGLAQADDIMMTHWQCTILGAPGTPVENRIISLLLTCGPQYPDRPPTVCFQSKLNFPFVGAGGAVQSTPFLKDWKRGNGIENVLTDLRRLMAKSEYKKLAQPAETATY